MATQRMMTLILWGNELVKNSLNRLVGTSEVDKLGSGINRKKKQHGDMRLCS